MKKNNIIVCAFGRAINDDTTLLCWGDEVDRISSGRVLAASGFFNVRYVVVISHDGKCAMCSFLM